MSVQWQKIIESILAFNGKKDNFLVYHNLENAQSVLKMYFLIIIIS
jgi:hypothetical protein